MGNMNNMMATAAIHAVERTLMTHELERRFGEDAVLDVCLTEDGEEVSLCYGGNEEDAPFCFPVGDSFMQALARMIPAGGDIIQGVKFSGKHIGALLEKNPTALETLLEEIASLPSLKKLVFNFLPFNPPNLGRFVRIVNNLAEPLCIHELELDGHCLGLTLRGGAIDVGLHSSPTSMMAIFANGARSGSFNLHDPLVKKVLTLPDLQSVVWPGCTLMADTFQQLCSMSHLVMLDIKDVYLDKFHATTLLNALTTPAKMVAGRKRKRSQQQQLGTLSGLTHLSLDDFRIERDEFAALWCMLGTNTTLVALSVTDVSIRPSYDRESHLWGPIFFHLGKNSTLQFLTLNTIYNQRPDGETFVQWDDEYTEYMSVGLYNVLHEECNETLTKVDFGFGPSPHPSAILNLLHLNVFHLRACVGPDAEHLERDEFLEAIILAVEQDEDDDCGTPPALLPCLFQIFQGNPTLVDFLH